MYLSLVKSGVQEKRERRLKEQIRSPVGGGFLIPELAKKFGIMSIPTIIIFENGEQREKHIGLWSKEDMVDTVNSYLK